MFRNSISFFHACGLFLSHLRADAVDAHAGWVGGDAHAAHAAQHMPGRVMLLNAEHGECGGCAGGLRNKWDHPNNLCVCRGPTPPFASAAVLVVRCRSVFEDFPDCRTTWARHQKEEGLRGRGAESGAAVVCPEVRAELFKPKSAAKKLKKRSVCIPVGGVIK